MTKAQRAFLERIAKMSHISFTTIKTAGDSRVAKSLEAMGLVERRQIFAYITDSGRAALADE